VAIGRIAKPEDTALTKVLVAALRSDRDPLTRHFLAVALGGIPSASVREALRDLYATGGDAERPFAALALGMQKDTDSAAKLRADLAAAKDESEKGCLCIALGLMPDAAAVQVVEETLDTAKKVWLKGYAALSLGMIGNTSCIAELRKKLEAEKDPRLRMNLAVALGMLHDPRAKTYLVDTLRGADTFYERGSAALALGALRCSAAALDLEAVYRDSKEKDILRAFAVVALGEIADPAPIPKLTRFSIDGNYDSSSKIDPLNEVLSIF
jgi:HEAT repeat protein